MSGLDTTVHTTKPGAVERRVRTVLGVALALLLGVGLAAYRETRALARSSEYLNHTHSVRIELATLLAALVDIETGQRGFVLTGDERFLQPYHDGLTTLGRSRAALGRLFAIDSGMQGRLRRLDPLIDQRVGFARRLVDIRRDTGLGTAIVEIRTGEGMVLLDAIRGEMAEMNAVGSSVLEAQQLEARGRARALGIWLGVACMLGLMTTAVGLVSVGRELRRRERADAALRDAHATLEARVQERTAELHAVQEYWRVALASIGDAVLVTDTHGLVTFMNASAESLTEWALEQARGQPIGQVFRIVNEASRQPLDDPTGRVLREGITVGLANHTLLLGRTGQERPIDDSGAPIRDASGQVVGAILVFRDVTEQRHAEARLRDSEERYRQIVHTANEGVWLVDRDGKTLFVNDRLARMLGWNPADMSGRPVSEFCEPEDVGLAMDRLNRNLAGQEEQFDARFKTAAGGHVWVLAVTSPTRDAAGHVIGALGLLTDITERRQIEQERATFQHLVEQSSDFIGMADLDGRITYVNRAGVGLVGASNLDALRGWSIWDLIAHTPESHLCDRIHAALQREGRWEGALPMAHVTTGAPIDVHWSSFVVRDPAGAAICLGIIAGDVRAQQRAASRLVEQLAITRTLTEHTQLCLLLTDQSQRITYVNAAAERVTGFTRARLVGSAFHDRVHATVPSDSALTANASGDGLDRDHGADTCPVRQAVASGTTLMNHEDVFSKPDGTHYPVRCHVHPIMSGESVIGSVIEVQDITAERWAAAERVEALRLEQKLRQEAEASNRAKDEFLAMLGHELRNPLAPIQTALQLMRLRKAGSVRERAIIERQVKHLIALVDDLLDVSRVTRGKVQLHLERIPLADAVARAVEIAQPLLEQQAHRLVVDVPRNGYDVVADLDRLAQVISNLLTNAAKYTPRGGLISVWAAHEPDFVAIGIRDTGIGISEDMLPLVFDPFVQERQGLDRRRGGLGLGLAIVRSLVALHHGTVSVHSEGRGLGSEFVVRLPTVQLEHETPRPEVEVATERRPTSRRSIRVLIVDDNEDAGRTLADALREEGHEVRVAFDGPEALEIAESFDPEIALLDIGLPVMDGYELARRFQRHPRLRHVPLVALTGYGQANDRERSKQVGFAAHLVKPVAFEIVRDLVSGTVPRDAQGSDLSVTS